MKELEEKLEQISSIKRDIYDMYIKKEGIDKYINLKSMDRVIIGFHSYTFNDIVDYLMDDAPKGSLFEYMEHQYTWSDVINYRGSRSISYLDYLKGDRYEHDDINVKAMSLYKAIENKKDLETFEKWLKNGKDY